MKTKIYFLAALFTTFFINAQIQDLSVRNSTKKLLQNSTQEEEKSTETNERLDLISHYYKNIPNATEITGKSSGYLLKDVYKKIDSLDEKLKNISHHEYNSKSYDDFKNLEKQIIDYTKIKEYLITVNSFEGVPKLTRKFFPLRSVYQANYFFNDNPNGENKINFVKDLSLIGNINGLFTLKANIVSGIFPLATKYVPVKISVNGTVSQQANNNLADSSTASEVPANKLQNGGLFNTEISYPIYFSNWKYAGNNFFTVYAPLSYRINIDDISDGVKFKDAYYYHEFSGALLVATDILQGYQQNENSTTVFSSFRFSFFKGSDSFKKNIEFNNFWLGQLNLGIRIQNKFIISSSLPVFSSEKDLLSKMYGSIGLTFLTK